ncbi:hypothetical protein JK628_07445 [Shewanella sp. KX20019]|uniref:hypothetical protein n=1 Tax=Shewanella sp. KX20019 TaxID=2803864 RepID=UPI001926FAE8|nr:hypothetical protein [Shewanella sp. KX20019]QQX81664.1 hypothetical protein JK628_07445 [Shewanella sp. KX20019]
MRLTNFLKTYRSAKSHTLNERLVLCHIAGRRNATLSQALALINLSKPKIMEAIRGLNEHGLTRVRLNVIELTFKGNSLFDPPLPATFSHPPSLPKVTEDFGWPVTELPEGLGWSHSHNANVEFK